MFTIIETKRLGLVIYAVFHGNTLLTTVLSEGAAINYIQRLSTRLKSL